MADANKMNEYLTPKKFSFRSSERKPKLLFILQNNIRFDNILNCKHFSRSGSIKMDALFSPFFRQIFFVGENWSSASIKFSFWAFIS